MTPTHEQLEAVANAMEGAIRHSPTDECWRGCRAKAQAAWDVIAPLVLEAAANVASLEGMEPGSIMEVTGIRAGCIPAWHEGARNAADRIRALK